MLKASCKLQEASCKLQVASCKCQYCVLDVGLSVWMFRAFEIRHAILTLLFVNCIWTKAIIWRISVSDASHTYVRHLTLISINRILLLGEDQYRLQLLYTQLHIIYSPRRKLVIETNERRCKFDFKRFIEAIIWNKWASLMSAKKTFNFKPSWNETITIKLQYEFLDSNISRFVEISY